MREHALKDKAVQPNETGRRQVEALLLDHFVYARGNPVGLLDVFGHVMPRLCLVILVNHARRRRAADVALDMPLGYIDEIPRWRKPIDLLKTNGDSPVLRTFALRRASRLVVVVKLFQIRVVIRHATPSISLSQAPSLTANDYLILFYWTL